MPLHVLYRLLIIPAHEFLKIFLVVQSANMWRETMRNGWIRGGSLARKSSPQPCGKNLASKTSSTATISIYLFVNLLPSKSVHISNLAILFHCIGSEMRMKSSGFGSGL